MTRRGHCLCGETTFEYDGPENWTGICHCESCRRQTASPATAFMGVPNGKWRWTGQQPETYSSSEGRVRSFCGNCGAPVAYQSDEYPNEIHFYAALLDDAESFRAEKQFHVGERLQWFDPKAEPSV